jgi:ribosomal protein S18 acetylase RimI-like enzyme
MAVMAALPDWSDPQVVELRRVSPADLEPVLAEEAVAWRNGLAWDLSSSADLVRRYTRMQALNGFALLDGPNVVGYAYYVREEHKGLIGDLYVLEHYRTPAREDALIDAVLSELWRLPGVRRTEAQLLMLSGSPGRSMPFSRWLSVHPRWFLEYPLTTSAAALAASERPGIRFLPWRESHFDDSAKLVAHAYRGHVDSEINDQYRSPAGARRFLSNIVEFPGCGVFFPPASYAAFDVSTGLLCGISLASLVAPDAGHVTQLCVAPSHRNAGLGGDLLRRSLLAFAAHGCRSTSLTVTAANEGALRLYERMGFVRRKQFAAHVWDFR